MRSANAVVAVVLTLLATSAYAADATDILETVQEKQLERWSGVDMYAVTQSIMGVGSTQYFRRAVLDVDSSDPQTFFLPFSPGSGACDGPMQMTPEMLEQYATASEEAGATLNSELRGTPSPVNPRALMGGNAAFLRAAAQAQRDATMDETGEAQQARDMAGNMAEFFRRAELVGTESVDGNPAYHLRAEEMGQLQQMDGEEFRVDAISVWIDQQNYVQLKMRLEGVITERGEERAMDMEVRQSDFRTVPNSRMYEPYRQVIQISGVLDEAQQAELQEAQQQLAEMEKEMASMPPDQRAMMERMMGGRLDAMRSMVSGGALEIEMLTSAIEVNPEMTEVAGQPCMPVTGAATSSAVAGADVATESTGAASAPSLEERQQACLEERIAQAQENQKKKRGLGRLMRGVSRAASRFGIGRDMSQTVGDLYAANATAEDLAAAAKDLGITEDDIEACRNP